MKAEENLTYFPVSDTGKVLKWKRVESLLPKGKKFKVIDVETGFYFYVQQSRLTPCRCSAAYTPRYENNEALI